MGISINVTFLLASLIVFWIIPAIGIAKKHLVDDRFFIRQWLFPMQYWLQLLFEKISGNRRIIVRILQIMSLFITYFCGCYTRPNKVAGQKALCQTKTNLTTE